MKYLAFMLIAPAIAIITTSFCAGIMSLDWHTEKGKKTLNGLYVLNILTILGILILIYG